MSDALELFHREATPLRLLTADPAAVLGRGLVLLHALPVPHPGEAAFQAVRQAVPDIDPWAWPLEREPVPPLSPTQRRRCEALTDPLAAAAQAGHPEAQAWWALWQAAGLHGGVVDWRAAADPNGPTSLSVLEVYVDPAAAPDKVREVLARAAAGPSGH